MTIGIAAVVAFILGTLSNEPHLLAKLPGGTLKPVTGSTSGGGSGTVTSVTATAPFSISSTPTTTPNVTSSMATSRFLGRVTAGTGVVEVLTPTQATALLNAATPSTNGLFSPAVMNEVLTSGTVTDFALATAGWTMNGDTDGSYVIDGVINTPAGSQGTTYSFQPNAVATNQHGGLFYTSGSPQFASVAIVQIGAGTTNAGRLTFRITFAAKSGRVRTVQCTANSFDATTLASALFVFAGEWSDTSTVVDGTTRIHGSAASQIVTGSTFKITRSLMSN